MQELIEAIRVAVAEGASGAQKQQGAAACRAILVALDAEPGKPLAIPNAPVAHPLAGLAPGQALDLLIAKLSASLPADDDKGNATKLEAPARGGIRIAFVPVPSQHRATGASARTSRAFVSPPPARPRPPRAPRPVTGRKP
jgi:hypothetical protein